MLDKRTLQRRRTRLLLAYAAREEAVSQLVESIPPTSEETEQAVRRWESAVADLQSQGPRELTDPIIGPLPSELSDRAETVASSPQFQSLLGPHKPRFGLVSLANLIAIQKMVYSDVGDLSGTNTGSNADIFKLTVPDPQPQQIAVLQDQGSGSYTMSSENPNLRIGGMVQADLMAPTPGGAQLPLHVLGFFATHGGPWMQAARLQGRWFLRDGYHRAYYLLDRGVARVPCVVVEVNSPQDLGVIRPGFVGAEVLFGDRPPFVGDFVNDRWSVAGSVVPTRKVVRIRAEEYVIPVDS